MAEKRLIPMTIKNCGNNKWLIGVDGESSYSVEGDVDCVRKALYRVKAKDGDGNKHCKSSKNGTYKSMFSSEDKETHTINVWKSKVPHSAEEFKSLMESSSKDIELTKNYIFEGFKISKGAILMFEEEMKFLPTDVWNKAKELNGDEQFEFIKKEVGDEFSDEEIKAFISKNLESVKENDEKQKILKKNLKQNKGDYYDRKRRSIF